MTQQDPAPRRTSVFPRHDRGTRPPAQMREPAVAVEKSVTPNYLVCLDTGARFVALRRHLEQTLQMTPDEYRARWALPPEYPMVAETYRQRRKLAQSLR